MGGGGLGSRGGGLRDAALPDSHTAAGHVTAAARSKKETNNAGSGTRTHLTLLSALLTRYWGKGHGRPLYTTLPTE